jgi:hypothetical protein
VASHFLLRIERLKRGLKEHRCPLEGAGGRKMQKKKKKEEKKEAAAPASTA